jgi:hypothetical protein
MGLDYHEPAYEHTFWWGSLVARMPDPTSKVDELGQAGGAFRRIRCSASHACASIRRPERMIRPRENGEGRGGRPSNRHLARAATLITLAQRDKRARAHRSDHA